MTTSSAKVRDDDFRVEGSRWKNAKGEWVGQKFICNHCEGEIRKYLLGTIWRWTCERCGRDYGYGTEEPVQP